MVRNFYNQIRIQHIKLDLKMHMRTPFFKKLKFVVQCNLNPVSELNKVITSLIDRRLPSKFIRQKVNGKAWFNKDCVNAFHNKQNAYHLWSQNR